MAERVGVRELRQHLSRWLRRVENGESFEVTDRGRPVAELRPLPPDDDVIARLVREGRVVQVGRGSLADLPPPEPLAPGEISISEALQEIREDKIQLSTLLYLDASALVKLVAEERETPSLRKELERWSRHASSVIAEVEVHRAALRVGRSTSVADAVLEPLTRLSFEGSVRGEARVVGSRFLRALDAIHLATALSLGDDLGAFCCYDRRLLADAEAAGLTILSPGLD